MSDYFYPGDFYPYDIYPGDVVTVRIETWEFECCAPLPVVGEESSWALRPMRDSLWFDGVMPGTLDHVRVEKVPRYFCGVSSLVAGSRGSMETAVVVELAVPARM
ncbi:hypothetical protein [Rhodococcus globerulus]|uniref:hypothetical protein n=1 Tax=Rhodococcus globerulus TaxID=33008 RepID=UPI000A71276E|nr:hypothetical protein [Rhodococcus globerulus]